jgi:hypothetical protein
MSRHQLACRIGLLVVLCMLISFNALTKQVAHAASTQGHRPTKDSLQILPLRKTSQDTPTSTVSLYESTTDAATMYNQGCNAARGTPGLIILDWGQPVYFGNNIYGTYDFGGNDDTDDSIMHAVADFAQGAWSCRTPSSDIAIGIGESNYYSGNAIPLTTAAWYADGQQWGILVNSVQSFISDNSYSIVGANGAGDLETGWENFTLTSSLVNGYNSVTSHIYFDFGDDAPGMWTNYQVWYVADGAADNLPLPEIYYSGNATDDWGPLDQWACLNEGGPMYFKGTMSQNDSATLSPTQSFSTLYNALTSNSCTASNLSSMIFSTQIFYA